MADFDAEFAAMQTVFITLNALEPGVRGRVMAYVASRLDLSYFAPMKQNVQTGAMIVEPPVINDSQEEESPFNNLAELFDASQPVSNANKALVAGYWLQVCQGRETFDSQSANKELKNLGNGVANITAAIDSLKNQKPALALQLRKSGRTQQARKTYKITVAGIKAVQNMISDND